MSFRAITDLAISQCTVGRKSRGRLLAVEHFASWHPEKTIIRVQSWLSSFWGVPNPLIARKDRGSARVVSWVIKYWIVFKPPLPETLKTPPFFSQWAKLQNFFETRAERKRPLARVDEGNDSKTWKTFGCLTGIDTKFLFGQSQPCGMSSRLIKKGSAA